MPAAVSNKYTYIFRVCVFHEHLLKESSMIQYEKGFAPCIFNFSESL